MHKEYQEEDHLEVTFGWVSELHAWQDGDGTIDVKETSQEIVDCHFGVR